MNRMKMDISVAFVNPTLRSWRRPIRTTRRNTRTWFLCLTHGKVHSPQHPLRNTSSHSRARARPTSLPGGWWTWKPPCSRGPCEPDGTSSPFPPEFRLLLPPY
jgi:hypothetical protein